MTTIDSTDPKGEKPATCEGLVSFEDIHFRYPARAEVQVSSTDNIYRTDYMVL